MALSPEHRAYRRDLDALPAEIRETVIRLEQCRARRVASVDCEREIGFDTGLVRGGF